MIEEYKKLKTAERDTETNLTKKQRETGDYQKGRVNIKGFDIVIENPVGSIRSGVDEDGNKWKVTMTYTYGYFKNTVGSDGDCIDVFIGPEIDSHFDIYVINQVKGKDREFDEHKVMFGFSCAEEAVKAYLDNFDKEWNGFDGMITYSLDAFSEWIRSPKLIKYPATEIDMNSKSKNTKPEEENVNIIKLYGEVIEGQTLNSLKSQAGAILPGSTLVVEIASPGGSVLEGLEIMVWLDELRTLNSIYVVTVVTANAYSIASLIMLAADMKLISMHGKVMVHNPMIPIIQYANANELEAQATHLRQLEGFMYDLYQSFTNLELQVIKSLMDNETYLLPDEAVAHGFADMVVNIKPKPYEMASKIKTEINMSETINKLKMVIAKVNGSQIVNQVYYDDKGGAIEIYQADPSSYQKGDKVSAPDGEVKLSDGSTLVIVDGTIQYIVRDTPVPAVEPVIPAVEPVIPAEPIVEPTVPNPSVEPLQEPISAIPTEPVVPVEPVVPTNSMEPVVPIAGEFNTGPAPKEPQMTSEEVYKMVKEMEMKVNEVKAQLEKQSSEIAAYRKQMIAQADDEKEFQKMAAEAIDTIASNTASNFKPEARVKLKPAATGSGSIFQQMRAKAGLS